ncbi:hypothetical protein [Curtobacterium sp. PsM8]|uniref:hypothetical protein n=1 Tax=Curtobacterium sp. PsM8 TaxID=3030532 RepID=UPI00263B29C3|nr:hypothetical protein [Curtobacterium sp. PsM8]MDN4649595.1 hypothetical protein [Curtobacterium sp. PsM8]
MTGQTGALVVNFRMPAHLPWFFALFAVSIMMPTPMAHAHATGPQSAATIAPAAADPVAIWRVCALLSSAVQCRTLQEYVVKVVMGPDDPSIVMGTVEVLR